MAEFDAFAQADQEATYDPDLFARYDENVQIRDFDGDSIFLSEQGCTGCLSSNAGNSSEF